MVSRSKMRTTWLGMSVALLMIVLTGAFALCFPLTSQTNTDAPEVMAESIGYFVPSGTPGTFWSQGGNIWLTPTGSQVRIDNSMLRTRFVNANPDVIVLGSYPLDIRVNVILGNDSSKWLQGESAYAQVVYREIYEGIDLHYQFLNGSLKSEYIIQPGSSLESIRVAYEPGVQLKSMDQGQVLQIGTPDGLIVKEEIPEAYQVVNGRRKPVQVFFELVSPSMYTFALRGHYDPSLPLIIDPVLLYSTYFGGSDDDAGWSIAQGKNGDTYIGGITRSLDLPDAPAPSANSGKNALVSRIDAQGQLVYITILGGVTSAGEEANAIAVDDAGNVYVTGETFSSDFPLKDAWQPYFAGYEDAYLAKLDPNGNLIYSTYIGGSGADEVNDIDVDASGNVYLGGEVYSDDYPLLNPWSSSVYGPEEEDAFLSIFNADGMLVYSTLFSAPQRDQIFKITVDKAGYVYGTGMTSSPDFPTVNAYQTNYGGGWDDCFILKFDPWNNHMIYSTLLGGVDRDECWGLIVDDDGNAYVTGRTTSPNFPVVNAYQPTYRGEYDIFVTKLSPEGNQVRFSTFLGGSLNDQAWGMARDGAGHLYITGATQSPEFLALAAIQPTFAGVQDAFVLVMSPQGSPLYASFLGGSEFDEGLAITVDRDWVAHVTGKTHSPDFPTQIPIMGYRGSGDAFIASFGLIPTPTPMPTPTPTPTPFVTTQMDSTGGIMSLVWPDHLTVLRVPQDVFNVTTQLTLTYEYRPSNQGYLFGNNHFFSVMAQAVNGNPLSSFSKPVQLELTFPPIAESDVLGLYWFNGQSWVTGTLTTTSNTPGYIMADITHTGIYGVMGANHPLYLPVSMHTLNTP